MGKFCDKKNNFFSVKISLEFKKNLFWKFICKRDWGHAKDYVGGHI